MQIGFLLDLAVPAPPASLSLGLAAQPPALTASWSPPPGDRGGFQMQLFCLRPLTLESEQILGPEVQNFSWAQLLPGGQFLVQLCTNNSGCTNATGWMCECPPTAFLMAPLVLGLPGGCLSPLTSLPSVGRQLG